MFARMLLIELGPDMRKIALDLADRWYAAVTTLPGFIRVDFLADESTGEYGYISFWDTLEQAKDADEKVGDQLSEILRYTVAASPRIRYFEVYEPNY